MQTKGEWDTLTTDVIVMYSVQTKGEHRGMDALDTILK